MRDRARLGLHLQVVFIDGGYSVSRAATYLGGVQSRCRTRRTMGAKVSIGSAR